MSRMLMKTKHLQNIYDTVFNMYVQKLSTQCLTLNYVTSVTCIAVNFCQFQFIDCPRGWLFHIQELFLHWL